VSWCQKFLENGCREILKLLRRKNNSKSKNFELSKSDEMKFLKNFSWCQKYVNMYVYIYVLSKKHPSRMSF
jgi:hypothetical protein